MKKRYLFILLMCVNCSFLTKKNIEYKKKEIEQFLSLQSFTVSKPINWRIVKQHGSISYTPIKSGNNYFNNLVTIFQLHTNKKTTLKEVAQTHVLNSFGVYDLTVHQIKKMKMKFGEVFVYEHESKWEKKIYKKHLVYFKLKENYYLYNYSSKKYLFERHFKDALSILENIQPKNKTTFK